VSAAERPEVVIVGAPSTTSTERSC
jgi:hypothetical protein